jgi:hypothetical protein
MRTTARKASGDDQGEPREMTKEIGGPLHEERRTTWARGPSHERNANSGCAIECDPRKSTSLLGHAAMMKRLWSDAPRADHRS